MRFSGSSSSGASSGITTTGLMCSARAEALRKLGGPCRDSGREMLSYPTSLLGTHPGPAGLGCAGRGAGTSGSFGTWMSLLKYSMSEARRKKFLRLQVKGRRVTGKPSALFEASL